jgi:uncharacterized membrane protein YoaK (UPF0700 family)
MAEGSRFPHLALPFALAGAAAGWLSATLAANPLVQNADTHTFRVAPLTTLVAGAAAGTLMTRWCTGRRLWYQVDEPDPEKRAEGDRWWKHALAVVVAGGLCGVTIALLCNAYNGPLMGGLGAMACSLAFLPVAFAVLGMARRARRARLGSIVAGSDRRSVWAILATALAVTTLEAVPGWPAAVDKELPAPTPAIAILAACGAVLLGVLVAEGAALRRAKAALAPGLVEHDAASTEVADTTVPQVDLGLGDGVAARVARTAQAYRGRDKALALVQGSPEQALSALRRAGARAAAGLVVVLGVFALHGLATTSSAQLFYDRHACASEEVEVACGRVAAVVRERDPIAAIALYDRACSASDAASCVALAGMYERGEGVPTNYMQASALHALACEAGAVESCKLGYRPQKRTIVFQQRAPR